MVSEVAAEMREREVKGWHEGQCWPAKYLKGGLRPEICSPHVLCLSSRWIFDEPRLPNSEFLCRPPPVSRLTLYPLYYSLPLYRNLQMYFTIQSQKKWRKITLHLNTKYFPLKTEIVMRTEEFSLFSSNKSNNKNSFRVWL